MIEVKENRPKLSIVSTSLAVRLRAVQNPIKRSISERKGAYSLAIAVVADSMSWDSFMFKITIDSEQRTVGSVTGKGCD